MNKERISFLLVIVVLLITIGCLTGKSISDNIRLSKLQDTVTKQAAAIENLEKQQNNVASYVPKYLDSIPDYD